MKKFTKIMLLIAGSLAALGIVFSGIAASDGSRMVNDPSESTCR